jgi:hypothetical protein
MGILMDIKTMIEALYVCNVEESKGCLDCPLLENGTDCLVILGREIIKALESLIWRDAEKDPPPDGERVLIYPVDEGIEAAEYSNGKYRFWGYWAGVGSDAIGGKGITHWLSLPQLPSTEVKS